MIQDLGKSGPLQIEHDGLSHSWLFDFYDGVLWKRQYNLNPTYELTLYWHAYYLYLINDFYEKHTFYDSFRNALVFRRPGHDSENFGQNSNSSYENHGANTWLIYCHHQPINMLSTKKMDKIGQSYLFAQIH
jgi:hypothetical protein